VRDPERRHGQAGGPPGAVRPTAFGTERDSLLISPLGRSITTRARFDLLDSEDSLKKLLRPLGQVDGGCEAPVDVLNLISKGDIYLPDQLRLLSTAQTLQFFGEELSGTG
jgi:hypothetical protein